MSRDGTGAPSIRQSKAKKARHKTNHCLRLAKCQRRIFLINISQSLPPVRSFSFLTWCIRISWVFWPHSSQTPHLIRAALLFGLVYFLTYAGRVSAFINTFLMRLKPSW